MLPRNQKLSCREYSFRLYLFSSPEAALKSLPSSNLDINNSSELKGAIEHIYSKLFPLKKDEALREILLGGVQYHVAIIIGDMETMDGSKFRMTIYMAQTLRIR